MSDPTKKVRVAITDWDDFQEFDVVVQMPGIDGGPFVVERDQPAPEPEYAPDTVARIVVRGTTVLAIRGKDIWWTAEGSFAENDDASDVRQLVVIDPAAVDVTLLRDVYANEAHVAADNDGILAVLTALGIETP